MPSHTQLVDEDDTYTKNIHLDIGSKLNEDQSETLVKNDIYFKHKLMFGNLSGF